jgi:hypothetical protein
MLWHRWNSSSVCTEGHRDIGRTLERLHFGIVPDHTLIGDFCSEIWRGTCRVTPRQRPGPREQG